MNIKRTNDTKRATIIFDTVSDRAIVYKIGKGWHVRAGLRQPGVIRPTGFLSTAFSTRKAAEAYAVKRLQELS